ncbi:hypothetical protein LWI28_004012 [Acer negundo]|uniref:Uncharacterized protein n=1 Tax=Acer negundo TaxID=4023 RepID=A0AAD5NIH7_ACENE|nr:hypothetical protein LWI28_004012 [Acer negundo]
MPRAKIVDLDKAPGSTNPRVPARGGVSRGAALNPDFEERMKGKTGQVQAADINRYHKTTFQNPIPTEVEHQFVRQNLRLANSLVVKSMKNWHAKNSPIRKSNPIKELAFWHLFISHNLRPSTHLSTVSFDVTKILFAFQAEEDIDVGHLTKMEIS